MIVVVDNRDSYTYNLVQLLLELSDHEVRIVDAGDPARIDDCLSWIDDGIVSGLVISPGPGHPSNLLDFGGSAMVLDAALAPALDLPVFGVCLGHQGIAVHFGGKVIAAPTARHGWRSPIEHDGTGPFSAVPQGTLATRYHSLVVDEPLPAGLRVTARSEDGVVQGIEVEGRPVWGVQFHPESIASEHGRHMVANFVAAVDARGRGALAGVELTGHDAERGDHPPTGTRYGPTSEALTVPTAQAASEKTAASAPSHTAAQAAPAGSDGAAQQDARDLFVASRTVRGPQVDGRAAAETAAAQIYRDLLRQGSASAWVEVPDETGRQAQWSILADDAQIASPDDGTELARVLRLVGDGSFGVVQRTLEGMRAVGGEGLAFRGGLLGFFGYELGVRMLGALPPVGDAAEPRLPDAWWLDPRRAVIVDRATGAVTVIATATRSALAESAADRFSEEVRAALDDQTARARHAGGPRGETAASVGHGSSSLDETASFARRGRQPSSDALVAGTWHTSRAQYAADIARCREHLLAGDSYELCLTNEFRPDADPDPFDLFLELRASDPAPYAALLEFDGGAVVSASPERFLRGTPDGDYETKPIKGTTARASDPLLDAAAARELANDPKVFAENLMIVDLLRNDLGRVCTPGSVHVPSLMAVESYATVHQLVTTVRGSAPGVPPLDVVRALFPGGSMTGAPKLRSVELLREIEGRNRGVYSGVLGVLGADGSTELSIVIRTAVRDARGWSIGAGGAIVLASDAEAETLEVELKASALRRAFARAAKG
ncbi:chorismate-binding protein [Pseudoclavibacter sp. RFBA6]|uniref:chorismate-binding protein n=1 Tax=Pseudoclavibacter sp. RFBA6 TaxID=2080573 RepID=UPI000CE7C90A|nr:chorismate-binding protein [Pseudoclavibacter sp. RFBA6]PPG42171.1 aminodeoxychorismate synthase component I [Pseudoclavibacter sp. RFBA6]